MSSMTLAQIAEKPMTVATEDAISSFADSRQRCLATSFRRPNSIVRSLPRYGTRYVVAALNGDGDVIMS